MEEALTDGRPIDGRLADELGALTTSLRLDGRTAADIEREVLGGTVSEITEEQRQARVLARRHNIDLSRARGSGKGGWVTPQDVQEYVKQRRFRQQREEQAREERERRWSGHVGHGVVLNNQERYQEAVQAQEEQERKEKEREASGHVDEGLALYRQERYQEAVQAFDRALGIDPSHALARDNKAMALRALSQDSEAPGDATLRASSREEWIDMLVIFSVLLLGTVLLLGYVLSPGAEAIGFIGTFLLVYGILKGAYLAYLKVVGARRS